MSEIKISPMAERLLGERLALHGIPEEKILYLNVATDFMCNAYRQEFLKTISLTSINSRGDWYAFKFHRKNGNPMTMKISKDFSAFSNIQGVCDLNRIRHTHRPLMGTFKRLSQKGIHIGRAISLNRKWNLERSKNKLETNLAERPNNIDKIYY